jgi:hypothetical protein
VRQKDPDLLKAVEHLARNETHTGISLLQAQGRVTELSNRQERIDVHNRDRGRIEAIDNDTVPRV